MKIRQKKIKINGKLVESPQYIVSVGSKIETVGPGGSAGGPDFSFLPHLVCVNPHKVYLAKEPRFCPELIFYDLKKGLSQLC